MLATLSLKWDHSSRVTTVQFIERETQWREFWAIFSKITFNCTICMHEQFVRLIAIQGTSFYHNRKCATVQILLCIKRNRLSILVQINLHTSFIAKKAKIEHAKCIGWSRIDRMIFAVGSFHEAFIVTSKQSQCLENVITSKMNQARLNWSPKARGSTFFSFVCFYYGLRCSLR